MLINIKDLVEKYNLKIKGVIIIGAFYGLDEERLFSSLGIKNLVFFEPSEFSYPVLRNNFTGKYPIYKIALGNKNKKVILHQEKDNGGMSSSILSPKKHLEYYPYIHFPKEYDIEVEMRTLDSFKFDSEYNMISMDVQGYEKYVLLGATNTLNNIDYINTEINFEELYEGCVLADELDQILTNFQRVETHKVPQGFGDALYIKRSLL